MRISNVSRNRRKQKFTGEANQNTVEEGDGAENIGRGGDVVEQSRLSR